MRMLRRAPGWPMHLAAVVATIGMLDACSAPGGYPECFVFTLLWLLLVVVWLFRFVASMILNRAAHRASAVKVQSWRRWAVVPLVVLLTIVLLSFDVPLRVRFSMSRNQLDRLAWQAAAGPRSITWRSAPVVRAGAYRVAIVDVEPTGEVRFWVPGTEFMRSFGGFAYCPMGVPNDPQGSFEPLGKHWYEWHTSW